MMRLISLLLLLLAGCTEPQPDCQAPFFMINSTLSCPAQHYEPPHAARHAAIAPTPGV